MFEGPPQPPLRFMLRHTASVPKGFPRYFILKLLKKKPMSGSEIMEEIEKQTDGLWKPSPGSVYPLLAWLLEKGYTKEVPSEKGEAMKRYVLTEKGIAAFEEESKLKNDLQRRVGFFAPPFLSGLWFGNHTDKLDVLHDPARRLARSMFDLRMTLDKNFSEQAIKEIAELLSSTAKRVKEINKKIKTTGK